MDLARELKDDEALEHDASLEIIAALDVGEMCELETALSLELGDEFDADEGATAEDPTLAAAVDGKARRSLARLATSPVGLAAWTVAFTAFYAEAEFGGSWAKGFYYTVQAGLSVGFGVLPERGNKLSLLVTILNVFLGAGVIAQCLASYAGRLRAASRGGDDFREIFDREKSSPTCLVGSATSATSGTPRLSSRRSSRGPARSASASSAASRSPRT